MKRMINFDFPISYLQVASKTSSGVQPWEPITVTQNITVKNRSFTSSVVILMIKILNNYAADLKGDNDEIQNSYTIVYVGHIYSFIHYSTLLS